MIKDKISFISSLEDKKRMFDVFKIEDYRELINLLAKILENEDLKNPSDFLEIINLFVLDIAKKQKDILCQCENCPPPPPPCRVFEFDPDGSAERGYIIPNNRELKMEEFSNLDYGLKTLISLNIL